MKTIYYIITFLVLTSPQNLLAQKKTKDQFSVKVDGLGCPFCAYGLDKKFKDLEGIKDIEIEMETGMLQFNIPSQPVMSLQKVANQVEKAGYTPVFVKVERAEGVKDSLVIALKKTRYAEKELKVSGNCNMCKERIEAAAKTVKGVKSAVWSAASQQIKLQLSDNTSLEKVSEAIAEAGHDTELSKSDTATYQNLPMCCLYR
ncbi:MAG: heavy-metal-associated domain-containing protein [Flavicella sp.]